jgi:hypothetical protein
MVLIKYLIRLERVIAYNSWNFPWKFIEHMVGVVLINWLISPKYFSIN